MSGGTHCGSSLYSRQGRRMKASRSALVSTGRISMFVAVSVPVLVSVAVSVAVVSTRATPEKPLRALMGHKYVNFGAVLGLAPIAPNAFYTLILNHLPKRPSAARSALHRPNRSESQKAAANSATAVAAPAAFDHWLTSASPPSTMSAASRLTRKVRQNGGWNGC